MVSIPPSKFYARVSHSLDLISSHLISFLPWLSLSTQPNPPFSLFLSIPSRSQTASLSLSSLPRHRLLSHDKRPHCARALSILSSVPSHCLTIQSFLSVDSLSLFFYLFLFVFLFPSGLGRRQQPSFASSLIRILDGGLHPLLH